MNLLLDTHIWIWWAEGSPELPNSLRAAIDSPENVVWVSAVSVWEVGIKRRLGKLKVDGDLMSDSIEHGLQFLPLNVDHALLVETLPDVHKDPFDRALVAQSMAERLHLATVDRLIQSYPGVQLVLVS